MFDWAFSAPKDEEMDVKTVESQIFEFEDSLKKFGEGI